MNPAIDIVWSYLIDYGVPVACFLVALYYALGHDRIKSYWVWGQRKLNWYLIAAVFFGFASVAAVSGYFWDQSRGAVVFAWNNNRSPLNIGRSGDEYYVSSFYIAGQNRWDAPITNIKTYIRSNKNADIVPMLFQTSGGSQAAEQIVIPGRLGFSIESAVPNGRNLKFDEFLAQFGSFHFFFSYDGGKYERDFDEQEIMACTRFG